MIILYLVAIYLLLGLAFAMPLLVKGIDVLDEATHATNWSFRLMILPGCVVFWPVLLSKYLKVKS